MIFLPAAIVSSRISLNRCESSLGSEQSIEQNNLQWEVTRYQAEILYPTKCYWLVIKMFLPVHFTLVLLVEVNQIIFLRVRSPIVCFKLLNISFSDLLANITKLHR